jgi:hypothetical protein
MAHLVVSTLKKEVESPLLEQKPERIRRILDVAFIPCAVREGSRLTRECMHPLT